MMWHEYMAAKLRPKRMGDRGASLIEYSLLLALIAIVCVGAVNFLGDNTADAYSELGDSLSN